MIQLAQQPYDFRQIARALDQFANVVGKRRVVLTDFLCQHKPAVSLAHVQAFLRDAETAKLGPIQRRDAEIAKQHDLDSKNSAVHDRSLKDKAILIRDLRDRELDDWQIRQVLGIGYETYAKLKSVRWQERPQTGIDSTYRPWSRVKESFNHDFCTRTENTHKKASVN